MNTADPKLVEAVSAALAVGFNMARSRPASELPKTLREATFHAPYELARLDKDAQDFRLEDMGPPPPLLDRSLDLYLDTYSKYTREPGQGYTIKDDARIFLRFPSGGAKATAAFVALNIPFSGNPLLDRNHPLIALRCWLRQYTEWEEKKPEVIKRLETGSGEFPVIFVLQHNASGSLWDTNEKQWKDDTSRVFLSFLPPQDLVPSPNEEKS